MILFREQIKTALEGETFTIPNVTVETSFPTQSPSYPLIVITENPSNDGILVDGKPRIVGNRYIIECYSRAVDLGDDGLLRADDAARLLGVEADTFLNNTYNFNQVGDSLSNPINEDNSVYRFVSRYTTIIDQNTGYIYRG